MDADCFDGIENASASSAAGFGRKQLMPGAGSVATPTRTLQGLPRKKTTHAVTGPRQTSSSKSLGLRTCSQPKRQYQKTIVDATCLRMMYVPVDMVDPVDNRGSWMNRPVALRGYCKNEGES